MRKILPVLLVAILSCIVQQGRAQTVEEESSRIVGPLDFEFEDQQRTYQLVKPPGDGSVHGIVLLLHGHGGSGEQLLGMNGRKAPYREWLRIATRERLILIVPDGLAGADRKAGWNDARRLNSNPKTDDVGFLNALVADVRQSNVAESVPAFVLGTSNGGHMALRLANEHPDIYDAATAVAAANPKPIFAAPPSAPISVMLICGTRDRLCPFAGGEMAAGRGLVHSAKETVEYWVSCNRCGAGKTTKFKDLTRRDRCTASKTIYRNEENGVFVGLVTITNGGHAEPSISQQYSRAFQLVVGRQNNDFEMADEVWQFFKSTLTKPPALASPQLRSESKNED